MEKEFVPYELAVKLKALGFDEECFSYYDLNNKPNFFGADNLMDTHCVQVTRPIFSQAFRWFREKYDMRHNIMDFIDDETGIEWDYEIATIGTDLDENGYYKPLVEYSLDDDNNRKFKTYEEAELACLNKLIEIVETKSE